MSKKTKQILAMVALVFMGLFSVSLVIWMAAQNLLDGRFGYVPLASGVVGIGLFLVVKFIKTPEEKAEALKKAEYLSDAARENLQGTPSGEETTEQKKPEQAENVAKENEGNVLPVEKTDGKQKKDAKSASKTAAK